MIHGHDISHVKAIKSTLLSSLVAATAARAEMRKKIFNQFWSWHTAATKALRGLIDEAHAVVMHAVEDVGNRGVLLFLTVPEHLDAGVLVGRHRLLGWFRQAVHVLDLVH